MGTTFIIFLLVMVMVSRNAESCGPDTDFPLLKINETVKKGSRILNITAETDVKWTIEGKVGGGFSERTEAFGWLSQTLRVNSTNGADPFYVYINVELDVEETYNLLKKVISNLAYVLTCTNAGGDTKKFDLKVQVIAVDEYHPQFIGAPYEFEMHEDDPKVFPLMTLRQNATDEDVVAGYDSDVASFSMEAILQPGQTKNMEGFLKMVDKKKGTIWVDKSLDFEAFPDPHNAFMVYNLTVYDTGMLSNSTNLTIYVKNVDDEPPEFYHSECVTDPCEVVYKCEVPYDYKGKINAVSPAAIYARDRDSLKSKVIYKIRSGPPRPKFRKHLSINRDTGVITVTKPLQPYERTKIDLIIEAEEVSKYKRSVNTKMTIHIDYPPDYLFPGERSTDAPTHAPSHEKDNSKTVVVAAVGLGSFILLVFIGLGVLFVYLKKRGEKPIYPSSDAGDEPDEDTTDAPVITRVRPKRVGNSSPDSGQFSMQGGSSARSRTSGSPAGQTPGQRRGGPKGAATGAKKAVRAKKAAPGTKGARRTGSARSDMSVGRQSKISIGDIHPQDDTEGAMMYNEQMEMGDMQGAYPEGNFYMDENGMYVDENGMYVDENGMYFDPSMYMDESMYQDGNMAMAQMQYGEEDETDFANGSMQQPAPRRPRPPKSVPPGKRGKALKTPKRPQSGVAKRREESSNNTAEDDEF